MFRCCSLETSHPRLLPQSPKVCSIHLCLFFCFAYIVCECGPFFNVFIEFVTTLLLFCVLAFRPRGMWHLTRDWTCTPCIESEVITTGPPGSPHCDFLELAHHHKSGRTSKIWLKMKRSYITRGPRGSFTPWAPWTHELYVKYNIFHFRDLSYS